MTRTAKERHERIEAAMTDAGRVAWYHIVGSAADADMAEETRADLMTAAICFAWLTFHALDYSGSFGEMATAFEKIMDSDDTPIRDFLRCIPPEDNGRGQAH